MILSSKEMKEFLERCWVEKPAAIFQGKAAWRIWVQNDMIKRLEAFHSKNKKKKIDKIKKIKK